MSRALPIQIFSKATALDRGTICMLKKNYFMNIRSSLSHINGDIKDCPPRVSPITVVQLACVLRIEYFSRNLILYRNNGMHITAWYSMGFVLLIPQGVWLCWSILKPFFWMCPSACRASQAAHSLQEMWEVNSELGELIRLFYIYSSHCGQGMRLSPSRFYSRLFSNRGAKHLHGLDAPGILIKITRFDIVPSALNSACVAALWN